MKRKLEIHTEHINHMYVILHIERLQNEVESFEPFNAQSIQQTNSISNYHKEQYIRFFFVALPKMDSKTVCLIVRIVVVNEWEIFSVNVQRKTHTKIRNVLGKRLMGKCTIANLKWKTACALRKISKFKMRLIFIWETQRVNHHSFHLKSTGFRAKTMFIQHLFKANSLFRGSATTSIRTDFLL